MQENLYINWLKFGSQPERSLEHIRRKDSHDLDDSRDGHRVIESYINKDDITQQL